MYPRSLTEGGRLIRDVDERPTDGFVILDSLWDTNEQQDTRNNKKNWIYV